MAKEKQIIFGEFRFDEANECLWRETEVVMLRPKAFAVLKYLLERPHQLVTKQQLLDAVWSDTFVSDGVLKDCIRQLRTALDDDVQAPRFIETAHRRGYRFICRIPENSGPEIEESDKTGNGSKYLFSSSDLSINPAASAFSETGVVGRESASSQMRTWLENALRGERQTVFVTGEPGIGKTTLVEAFLQEISSVPKICIARGQCLEQFGEGEAYLPVLEAISRLGRDAHRQNFVGLLTTHAPTWLAQIPSLMNAAESALLEPRLLGATRERMLREMAETIEALTAENPLVLVLEDLHWSDYSTLDLVSYLARRRAPARLMLIGTYRPVELILNEHPLKSIKRELQMHRLCRELPLEYLTETAVAEFIARRFPKHQFPPELAAIIHHRTGGNPLFMVNTVDYLIDEKIIVEQADGDWQLRAAPVEVEPGVPENVRHLIERQIERLSDEEQRVLEAASIVGMDCSAVAIASGMKEDLVKIEEICDRLARNHQFLLPAYLAKLPDGTITPRYKFIHVLYLDVLYKRAAATRRVQIHRRVGERGEEVYGSRVGEIAAELAVHFEQAQDWSRTLKYLRIAAENARHRFANHEALVLAQRGLDLLNNLPESPEQKAEEIALRDLLKSSNNAV